MINLCLMIVEDEPVLLSRLEKILKREVFKVYAFDSPQKALSEFESIKPDVVLTDIKMPEMSGLEMIERIRTMDVGIPVIVASAFSDPDYFQKAIKLKVENFVIKPIDIESLLSELRQVEKNHLLAQGYRARGKLLEEYKKIVDNSNNITKTDMKGNFTYANDKFLQLSGYSREELIGKPHSIVRHPDMPASFFKRMWGTILAKHIWHGTIKNRSKNGEVYYVETTIAPILDENDEIIEFISVKNDVTKLIMHKQLLQEQIMTDPLTGLYNRIKLKNDMKDRHSPSIILLDINNFKEVNNLFGFYFGDQMLIYIGSVLDTLCSTLNVGYYRISADEFVILLPDEYAQKEVLSIISTVAGYLSEHPFEFNSISFDIEMTFGIAQSSEKFKKSMLLGMADTAMHNARKSNLLYAFYDVEFDPQKEYEHNFKWTQKIKKALSDDRIDIFYQPIVSTRDGKIKKYECLIRYIEEDGTIISPYAFLEVAKRSRLYADLTRTVIAKACRTFRSRNEKFSINLSIEDILNQTTIRYLIDQAKEHSVAERMIVEILESEGIDNYTAVVNVIEQLKTQNIEIAIDDFGTGYSNFAYLISLDIDTLKIDGSLVKNIDTNPSSRSIVRSIVGFAQELGIKTVAEFVGSESVYHIIKEIGVDFAQGYYLSEPIPYSRLPE